MSLISSYVKRGQSIHYSNKYRDFLNTEGAVVTLQQTPEDDLRSARAACGRQTS